jgi:hypothetical protein
VLKTLYIVLDIENNEQNYCNFLIKQFLTHEDGQLTPKHVVV